MKRERPLRLRRDDPGGKLEREIRREIDTGGLKPHDRLRGEKALAAQYRVGLQAVRSAIRGLRTAGYLYTRPRSGVFVAGLTGRIDPARGAGEGLHALEIMHGAVCRLSFLILGWNSANREAWERICRGISVAKPSLRVEPRFPSNSREYEQWCPRSDAFITSTMDQALYQGGRRAAWMAPSDLAGLPLADRYVKAVSMADHVLGIPVSGSLLPGAISPRFVPASAQEALRDARSWDVVLPLLALLRARHPRTAGINFNPTQTLNLFHHLMHTAGEIVDPVSRKMLVTGGDFRRALACWEEHRDKAFPVRERREAYLDPRRCCTCLEWTVAFPRSAEFYAMTPWLFPLGRRGFYLEGLNIGAVSRDTPYPEECREFLRYLLSDSVQQELVRTPGEHPVSSAIKEPFAGFDKRWQCVLAEVRERSRVCREHTPGYNEFLGTIFFPLATRFFHGEIDSGELVRRLDERGQRFFARLDEGGREKQGAT